MISEYYENTATSNYRLLLPYFAPYIAFVGVASLFSGISVELSYSLNIIVVTAILIWAWRRYVPFTGPKNIVMSMVWGVVCGLCGMVVWIVAVRPFVNFEIDGLSNTAFYLRLIAASVLVPVFEELLMRCYIFRITYQWDRQRKLDQKRAIDRVLHDQSINQFEPGAWSISAALVSTVAFTLGHQMHQWPAAFLYGLLMVLLWITRKDLISCIVAHGTTNLSLGLFIYFTNQWELW